MYAEKDYCRQGGREEEREGGQEEGKEDVWDGKGVRI